MDLQLKGKRALVTGASRGLGYATASGLSAEGARVAINSRNPQSVQEAARTIQTASGNEVIAISGDVTDPKQPSRIIEQAVEQLGGLDLLVTNAGGPPSGKFEAFDDDTWHTAVQLSLMSHVRLIRAALPALRQSQSASVLTLTSYSVKQPIPNLVLSNSVRAATVGLTKTLALELGNEGIRFNSILPAWTETERVQELMEFRARANGTTAEEELRKQSAESPFNRMGTPQEFANAAVFLLSPAASFITGVMLTVDGGMYKGIY
jgi:3-oxoacyl-[acyl-carrier protein] reductase